MSAKVMYFLKRRGEDNLTGPFDTKQQALAFAKDCEWDAEVVQKNVRVSYR